MDMASNYRDIVSNSNDSMLDQTDLEISHSIDLLTNRSSGTLISATAKKDLAYKTDACIVEPNIKSVDGAKLLKPLTKYSSSNNLTMIDSLSEDTGRLGTIPLNKFMSRSTENVSADKNSRSNFPSPSKEGQAKIVLICEPSSHPFQTRTIWLSPNSDCKVGRLISKHKVNVSNAIFDCKVLSRNHALFSYSDNEKFWLKDLNSSNGTFLNDKKLGIDAAELHFGDIVRFGVDVVEHTKNELHGCIKACVELYFPNGQPASPANSDKVQHSEYSGEGCISYDDLHQLSVYMQEATQRKQTFEFELQNAQNLLDATRHNTSDSWQTLLNKDQALQRIQLLEKKMKILEKNMSEQALKNEITKLKEEKIAYQISAKEVLENVRLESCEAMQKLSKMESTLAASKSNYKVLLKQIVNTDAALKDANDRLCQLESEYNDFRVKSEEVKVKTQLEYEQHIEELKEKVQKQNEHCNSLQIQLDEILQQNSISDVNKTLIVHATTPTPASAIAHKRLTLSPRIDNDFENFNVAPDLYDEEKEKQSIFQWPQNFGLNKKRGSMDIHKATYYNESNFIDSTEKLKHLEQHVNELKNEIDESFAVYNKNDNDNNQIASIADKIKNMKLMKTYESIFDSFKQLKEAAEKTFELQEAALGTRSQASQVEENEENFDTAEFSDGAQALQVRIKKLKAKLRAKDRDIKFTLDALVIKRDTYKEKVAELLKISENWRQEKETTTQQVSTKKATKVTSGVGEASGDHVSCDSGVSVLDKMTETSSKAIVDASSNTMISVNLSEVAYTGNASTPIKHELQNKLSMVKSTMAQREEQLKKYKENLETMQQNNAKLRQNITDLRAMRPVMQVLLPIVIFGVGVFFYLIQNYV